MTGPILRPPPSAAVAAARAAAGRGGRGLKRSRPASWMASISQGSNPRGYCCCLLALASTAAAAAGAAAAGGGRGTTTTLLRRAVYIAAFQPAHPLPTTSAPRRRLLASSATAGGGGGMMDDPFSLRTPVPVDPLPTAVRIKHADQLVLMGSCFSDNIGSRLQALKYTVDTNPFGTSYNPVSLQRCLLRLLENRPFELGELGRHPRDGVFYSLEHHTSFSHPDADVALQGINERLHSGHEALLRAKHLFLTLGTAHVYESAGGGSGERRVVANCHRLPQVTFERRLLGVDEIVTALEDALVRLRAANPALAVTLTVSPVRHLRNAGGAVANARSKAHLLAAVHELVDRSSGTNNSSSSHNNQGTAAALPPLAYFPAFEIMNDDLRDYRFYDADMLHPSAVAIDFIFHRLQQSHLAPSDHALLKALASLRSALAHRPSDPSSPAHQAFVQNQLGALQALRAQHPHLELAAEEGALRKALLD